MAVIFTGEAFRQHRFIIVENIAGCYSIRQLFCGGDAECRHKRATMGDRAATTAPAVADEIRPVSTRYREVADRMRADILRGDLRAETRLKLRELAVRYGVSIAPIRESLQQLQGEGLVIMQPHRGASVRRIDEAMLINVFDVREAIESFLTMQFATAASPHQIAELETLQGEHDTQVEAGDYTAAQLVNARFHRLINASARNQEALGILDRHLAMTRAFRQEAGFSPMRMRATRVEHRELIAALRKHDAEAARRIAAWHVRSSRDDLLGRLRPFIAPNSPGGTTT
jgi:DNA-binding GntR family transcriptional regulator